MVQTSDIVVVLTYAVKTHSHLSLVEQLPELFSVAVSNC